MRWTVENRKDVNQVFAAAVAKWPDKQAFDFLGETTSFSQLNGQIAEMAHGLLALGVRKGDTVATMLDTSMDLVRLMYAIMRIGAIYAPVNSSYKGEFLRHQIADIGAAVVIAESDYAERIVAIEAELPDARTLLHRGERPDAASGLDLRPFDDLKTGHTDPIHVEVAPHDLALIIYTSGTTGPSKGCMISHNYICHFASRVAEAIALTESDTVWTPTPLFHANAIASAVLAGPLTGAGIALYPRFSVSHFWPEIRRTGATVINILGSMIALVANAPESEAEKACVGQLRLALGAPFTEPLKEVWRERFGVRHVGAPGFGMTECCPMVIQNVMEPAPPGTSGHVYEDFDTRTIDENGNECPPGVPGEIITRPNRPDIMFSGYWRRPQASMDVMKNLWFHTGDIGALDENGYLTFVDRKKDYLRRGGENISSFEMESSLRAHPDILDVAVHAVPSELSEDEVKATVVLRDGSDLSAEELCRWTIDRVPYFAVPRYIEFRADLPRTPTGRVQKFELRADGVTGQTWDRMQSGIVMEKR